MDTIDAVDVRKQLGLLPIPGDAPAGINAVEEPEYEELQAEMAKMESDGPTAVDWTIVIRSCEAILRDKSKDIKVATYYGYALFRRQGWPGLAIALTVVRDMVVTHWDGLFPPVKRMRARTNAVEWLASKIGPVLQEQAPPAAEKAAFTECYALLDEVDRVMSEKGAQASLMDLLRPMRDLDREYKRDLEAAKAEEEKRAKEAAEKAEADARAREEAANRPPATEAAPAAPAPAAAAASSVAAPVVQAVAVPQGANTQQIDAALGTAATGLKSVAKALLEAKLSDPRPYQILRFASWIVLPQLPPAQNGRTMLMSPPPDRMKMLAELVQAGKFQEAIPQIEASFGNALFWLDAHRLTATALEGLGPEYATARKAVVGALGDFLRRFPGIVDLQFQNGVPFADPLTRSWIVGEVLAGGGEGGGAAVEPWDAATAEARKLAGQGKIADAAALFAQGRRQADGERARLMWELAQARFCAEIGNMLVAAPILEYLDDQIDARGLDAWEPSAAIEATKLLLDCYRKMPAATPVPAPIPGQPGLGQPAGTAQVHRLDEARRARVAKLQARLSRLDVAEALSLMKV